MDNQSFYNTLSTEFGFIPSESQAQLFVVLEKFARNQNSRDILVIRGYAGTGKEQFSDFGNNFFFTVGKFKPDVFKG